MPQEGAAILTKIKGEMEQFLSLDYESPVKDTIRSMLPSIDEGISTLRQQADTGEVAPSPEASAALDQGPPVDQVGQVGGGDSFQAASKAALADHEAQGDYFARRRKRSKAPPGGGEGTDQTQEAQQKKQRKRIKAGS
jgi:hypothetical protein